MNNDVREQLRLQFEVIRDERRKNANTAERIGSAFLSLLSYIDLSDTNLSTNYLRKDKEDKTSYLVTFEAGINIGEDIYNIDAAGNAILRSLKSGPFDPGKGEKGTFDLYVADDRSYLDIDNINIRESLNVKYLQIGNGLLKWDEENKAFYVEQLDGTPASFYATKGLSALGFNDISDTGTGSFDLLQDWDKYVDETAKSMALSAYLGKDLLDRITSLEKGQKGHKITISGSGNVVVNVEESSDGGTLTFTKRNIDLSGYATKTELEAVSKKTDSVTQRVDEFLGGSDTDGIINKWKELEAFLDGQQQGTTLSSLLDKKVDKTIQVKAGEGLSGGGALSGNITLSLATVGTAGTYTKVTVDKYGRVTGHATLSASDIPTLEISKINGLQEELDKKLNISDFGNKFATEMANWFKKDTEGNVFVAKSKGFYSESFVSAMGKSSGGSSSGGGSYDRLDNWADYSADRATWVLSAKLGYDLNTRVSSLESGSAINFETSGTGNALTGFSKSGNTVTFTKGTFLTEHQKLYTLTMQRNGEGVGSYVPTADKIININACTAINVPQGFTAGALSSVGVIALSFASGYSLPTTAKQQQWDTAYSFVESIAGSDANGVIDKWNEIISFLDGIGDSSTLEGLLNDINSNVTAVSSRVTKLEGYFVNGVAKEAAKTTGTLSINGKNFNGSASVNVGVIGVSYGGTGKSSVASGSMLYASAANTYAELATTEFGRNLLKANSGSVVSGLNADMLDGVHVNGLFTAAGWNTQTLTITIGGVTKSVTIPYASASVVGLVSTAAQTFGGTKTFNAGLIVPAGQSLKIGNGTITWDSTKACFHFSHGLYSDSFISAMGLNDSGSGGGSASYERLDNWTDYAEEKATWVLSAKLGNELNERLKSVEAGGATSVVTTGTGNVITAISKNGNTITATKGITALTSHQAIYSLTLQGNGTTIGTFNPKSANATINITAANIGAAAASHTHTLSALSDLKAGWSTLLKEDPKAYVTRWPAFSEVTSKPTTLAGYGITDAYTKTDADSRYVNVSGDTMTGHLKFNPGIQATWSVKGTSYITNGNTDSGTTVGGDLANLVISSWFGVSFTTACAEQPYTNKTAVGIDCRNGIVKAAMFAGNLQGNADTATNADKLDGVHLGGLFTDFSTSNESTNITIGGVTKSLKINADTLDGLHEASFNRIYGRYSISTTGTAPYNYIHLFRIACSNGYSTLRVDVDFKSRYHAGLLAIDITTQEFPYGDSAGHGTSIKISKDSINGRTGQFYWIRTTQESGYNYYDIYYKSGAWNTGRFDLRVRGGSGTLVFEVKGTNLNSLPEGCTEVLDTTYSGTASNAVKLATPRTLWGQSFDGSANVSGNIYDTQIVQSVSGKYLDLKGATGLGFYTQNIVKAVIQPNGNFGIGTTNPLYKLHVLGNIYAEAAGIISTAGNAFRLAYGNYGTILRSDGDAFYILATNKGEASNGTFNKFRPFRFDLATGGVNLVQTGESLTVGGDTQFNKSVSIGNGKIEWDEANKAFKFTGGIYSDSYISAMGLNAAGGSGGSYERLDSWSDYTEDKATWVLSALLGSNLNTRVSALEAGGATSVVTSGTGNVVTAVTKSGNVITATKGITALTSHQNIYALTLQGNGSTIGTFNPKTGNSTINITAANIGAAASSHTHNNYLPLTGGTMTGSINSGSMDGTWIGGLNKAALNIYHSGYGAIFSAPVKSGRISLSTFPSSSDILYFGFATSSHISAGTNSFNKQMQWNASANSLTADKFIGDLDGDITGNSATTNQLNASGLTSQSLADYKTSGHLYYAGGSNTVSDKPSGVDAFGMFTMQTASGWQGQILMASNTATSLYWRTANNNFNGGWRKILDSSNYGEYVPTKTGTGASGTWGINISGNAATASKLATARTINGTNFDGSANITTSYWGTARNIYIQDATAAHTGAAVSVNGSGNINLKLPSTITAALSGNASTASKWQAARTVTMNGFADCSFSIDGSSNVSFDYKPYNFYLSVNNKNNYPWHRIAKIGPITAFYQDKEVTLLLSQGYAGGKWGIVRITLRTNSTGTVSTAHVEWLNRRAFNRTDVKIGLYNASGETYADVFLWTNGAYSSVTGLVLTQGGRGTLGRTWTLVNSSEVNNTTTTDKLTSTECWTSIEVAAEELHKKAYTNIIEADDAGGVGILYDHGKLTAISGTTMPNEGLRLYRAYNNGYPAAYGNLMSVRGENSGAGELLLEWKGSTELGHIYYRSKRDNTSSGWSSWGTLAFLTDNVASATKLQTARSINGTSFDGTENITTFKWGSSRNIYIRDASQTHTGEAVSVDGSSNEYLLLPKDVAFDQITINTKLISNGQTDFNKQWLKNVGGIWFGSADSSSVFASFDGDGTQTGLQSKVGTSIYFGWRGGTRAMTIDSAGNVVIGNTSTVNSAYKLDVKGDVRTQGDIVPYSNGQYNIGSSGARWNTLFTQSIELYGFTPYIDFHFNNSSADYTSRIVEVVSGCLAINGTLAVLKSGNVGIGTTLPTEKLYVSGNIAATGAVTALVLSSSSDIRLKDIRKNVCLSVEEIAKAPAVEFAWKKTGDLAVGSIAQYWQPILPQAIHKRDNYLSMQYDVIALLASIANARRILSIEKKIKELEEEVKRLKIS
nr:MAG TPA: LARGE TAIL FIBER PROTEIN P34 PROTEIN, CAUDOVIRALES, MYOVIRIDAE, TRIPLE [Caudoviricetes sp.]